MAIIHFELITEVQQVLRRDFPMNDPTLLNPTSANPLLDGEMVILNSAYKLIRASANSAVPAWAIFAERGRYDTQAIGKVTVLFGHTYEVDTRVFASTPTLGAALGCQDATVDSLTKSGVGTYSSGVILGYVTRTAASNGGRLRFIQTLV